MGSFGQLGSLRGATICLDMGSLRGATPPKDATVRDGDLWKAYKRTRVLNQGRKKFAKTKRQGELYDSEVDEEEELPQGAKSLHSGRTCAALRRRVQ
jgi:hypothetical protein